MRDRRKTGGFTLLELMITVAIIGVLAAIAIPTYIGFSYRSKSGEVRVMLGAIKSSLTAFGAAYDGYPDVAAHPAGVESAQKRPWNPVGVCPAACSPQNVALCNNYECFGLRPNGGGWVHYTYAVAARARGGGVPAEYALGARGDLDEDGNLSLWGLQSADTIGQTVGQIPDPFGACPVGLPAGEPTDCSPLTW